jgi:hypothetical protein
MLNDNAMKKNGMAEMRKTSYPRGVLFIREIALEKSEEISPILHRERLLVQREFFQTQKGLWQLPSFLSRQILLF